ncbi:hypothetical protein EZH22_24675 [Xanthobacter dioxanivorans]|uniref:Uncharacterized protein n=1 Tax=Xanthobacter dioxanivorans TaxID=2528964 RepID=A0A974SHX9_9HYPH|nr:hypothetical protein [Xanthobacter dioxanivorans]QRG06145.1 hypothetical protein EZH22_24675 [Xanthobacter dioxanivorans]
MREQRAFAAVYATKSGHCIVTPTVRGLAQEARIAAGMFWNDGWEGAKRRGWRIRPVLIRIEDAEEPSHDRR